MSFAWNELTVRNDPKSNILLPKLRGTRKVPYINPMIILIHGYNVDEAEGRKSYFDMFTGLRKSGVPVNYRENIYRFYWPGNTAIKLFSGASYPWQISTARKSAKLLGDFLIGAVNESSTTEFVFIAHSLGCRLLLEMISYINGVKPDFHNSISITVLMAAAVPVELISSNGQAWGSNTFNKIIASTKSKVLYSPFDKTLRWLFPIGQTARLEGALPEAVGLHGQPRTAWTDSRDAQIDHGEYWKNVPVAEYVAESLGFAVRRTLPTYKIHKRALPVYRV